MINPPLSITQTSIVRRNGLPDIQRVFSYFASQLVVTEAQQVSSNPLIEARFLQSGFQQLEFEFLYPRIDIDR